MQVGFAFILLISLIKQCLSFPNGAPEDACDTLTPGHRRFRPQLSVPPFKLWADKTTVEGGDRVRLTLAALGTTPFRGFIIQARDAAMQGIRVGFFRPAEGLRTMNCGDGFRNSVTHNSSLDKRTVSVFWTAPEDFQGEVFFRYSIGIVTTILLSQSTRHFLLFIVPIALSLRLWIRIDTKIFFFNLFGRFATFKETQLRIQIIFAAFKF